MRLFGDGQLLWGKQNSTLEGTTEVGRKLVPVGDGGFGQITRFDLVRDDGASL